MAESIPPELRSLMQWAARNVSGVLIGLGAIVLLLSASSLVYTVQPSEEVVITRLGRYSRTTSPGLHLKLPFGIDRAVKVTTKLVLQEEFGFRSAGASRAGTTQYDSKNYHKESQMLTGDLNVADVEWIVQYQISDPKKFLFQSANPRATIRDISEAIMRRVVGDRTVNEVLTTGRVEISGAARELTQEVLDKYDIGIRIITVALQDVNPPERVKASFNEVNAAKQEQEQAINQAEEAYNKVIPEARGKAEETLSRAEGYASAVVNQAQGDAERFSLRLKEYRLAPGITRKRLYLEAMEKLFARFDKITLVDDQLPGLLPIHSHLLPDASGAANTGRAQPAASPSAPRAGATHAPRSRGHRS